VASAEKLSKEALAVGDSAVTPEDVVGLQQQVARIATLVAGGSLAERVDTAAVSDDEVATAEQINAILDAVQGSVISVAADLERVGQGDIPEASEAPCAEGELGRLHAALGLAVSGVAGILGAIDEFHARQVEAADFEYHIVPDDYAGAYARAAAQVNASADIHIDCILEFLGVVTQYSQGDFGVNIGPRPGKQVVANQSFDALQRNLQGLESETKRLLAAAAAGELDVRGDTSAFEGAFVDLVGGINATLDSFAEKTHLYHSVLDAIPYPLSVTDNDMRWVFINKAASDVTGISREEALGRPCSEWGADICNTERCGIAMLRTGETSSTFTQPGLDMTFRVDTSHLLGPTGEQIGHVEIVRDITDITRANEYSEQHVRRVVANLNKLAAGDLTIDLSVDPADESTERLFDVFSRVNGSMAVVRDTVASLVDNADGLAAAAVAGKLSQRADISAYQGAYARLIEGINAMLDAIMAPINEATETLEHLANRDLTARVDGEYQGDYNRIKEALNQAAGNLDEGFAQVALAANQVTGAAAEINTGSQAVAQGAAEQASSLEEISSNLEQMASMTKQNAGNAHEAKGMSDTARTSAERGVDSMTRLSEAIDRIKSSSDETAKIVKTIDEIAFQTNLLALNAAVEAARAGDAGKGFAVVAEEVRNLAMRSAEAAKSTADLIDESVHNAEDGVTINQEVFTNLAEISEQIRKVTEVMDEIAAASDQQSQGIDQINSAVSQLDQVTQQNAANSEESASAAEELTAQAEELRAMVGNFQLSNDGTMGAVAQVQTAPRARRAPAPRHIERPARVVGDSRNVIPFDDDDPDDAILQQF